MAFCSQPYRVENAHWTYVRNKCRWIYDSYGDVFCQLIREVAVDKSTQAETWVQFKRWFDSDYNDLILPPINAVKNKTLAQAFEESEESIAELIEAFDGNITGAYDTLSSDVSTQLTAITRAIAAFISNTDWYIQSAQTKLNEAYSNQAGGYEAILSSTVSAIEGIESDFRSGLTDTFDLFNRSINDVYLNYKDSFDVFVGTNINNLNSLYRSAIEGLSEIEQEFSNSLDTELSSTLDVIDEGLRQIITRTGTTQTSINNLIKAINDTIAPSMEAIESKLGASLGYVSGEESTAQSQKGQSVQIPASTSHLISTVLGREQNKAFSRMFTAMAANIGDPEKVAEIMQGEEYQETLVGWLLTTVLQLAGSGMMALQSIGLSNQARMTELSQEIWRHNPNKTLSPPEATSLYTRGFLSYEEFTDQLNREGLSNEKADLLAQGTEQHLDTERASALFRRGDIDEADYKTNLERLGYTQKAIDGINSLNHIIPGLQDLISMAVRDAFSPSVVSEFRLDSDFPEDFSYWARKQGLSEDWAKKYWAAHWRLPSSGQGFEMFHRGIISEDQLNLLLKALDLSPFWRDKLKLMAYQPITRVDVRRIYALGIIDLDEVNRRYQDLGYSPDDAAAMTEFTRLYSGEQEDDEDVDIRELNRSQILKLWTLGTINDDEAKTMLIDLSYSAELARLLVNSWKDEQTLKERDDMINRLARKAIRENLKDNQIEALFYNLNLTREELTKVKEVILIDQKEKTSIPSKTELKKMKESNLITMDEWSDTMSMMGYSDWWITKYRQLYFGV